MQPKNDAIISWSVEEYSHKEKGSDWFWALGVIALAIAVIAIIYHNILFAIVIILGSIILGYYASRPPNIMDVSLSTKGIQVREIFYPYEKIRGFAVERHILGNCLLIETGRAVLPVVSIPLPQEELDMESLENFLVQYVEKKDLKESAGQRIMEHLGF